jgi:hypothetical protein
MFTTILGGIVSFISGPLIAYLGKLSDNDTAKFRAATGAERDIMVAQLTANAAAWHDRAALLSGLRMTQLLLLAALAPALYHQALVFLDSCPFFGLPYFAHAQGSWKVAALPGPYADREWALIASLLGIQTGLVGVGSYLRYLRK